MLDTIHLPSSHTRFLKELVKRSRKVVQDETSCNFRNSLIASLKLELRLISRLCEIHDAIDELGPYQTHHIAEGAFGNTV